MDADWVGVRARLERLRDEAPPTRKAAVFGARGHGFQIAPRLTEAEMTEAEGQFGVTLPPEYRAFLLEVSAGGAGPFHGIFSLARNPAGRWGWTGEDGDLTDLARLGVPFEPGDISAPLEAARAGEPDEDDEDAHEAWLDRVEGILWEESRTHGAICLCHQGDALRNWLVVSGPRRGLIWEDLRADQDDLAPETAADGSPLTFGRWYLNWLEAAEATVGRDFHP